MSEASVESPTSASEPRHGPNSVLPARDAWKRPDLKARALRHMVAMRSTLPGWHVAALGTVAKSEAEGVRVLEAALPAVRGLKLRNLFQKHIKDEHRHTEGFTRLYEEAAGKPLVRSGNQPALGMNIIDLFAYLEITEVRGEQMIRNYHELFRDYPDIVAFLETVLRDERFHANYLHAQLENWSEQGMAEAVANGRRSAARIDTRGFLIQLVDFSLIFPRIALRRFLRIFRTPFSRKKSTAKNGSPAPLVEAA